MKTLFLDDVASELGRIVLVTDGVALCALDFAEAQTRMMTGLEKRFGAVQWVSQADPQGFSGCLRAYLAGELTHLQTLPVNPGGTPFQQQVWLTLRSIPVGTVITYADLAQRVGKPTAYRAVGMANGQNPIAIALPCHRVIGSNRQLTGYSGGLARKRWLLQHEGVCLERDRPA
ncbi:MAG: methylated-DNA--[protein]-cysteine S-methyltransferase [Leptolyngbyaceae cyanobacterium bins.349]|nr:methylated-DNA--[protein]-cysteine S-methyltransferase [Leptolyngbyaceae cyanobacterium bins.349]